AHARRRDRIARIAVELLEQIDQAREPRGAGLAVPTQDAGDEAVEFVAVDRGPEDIQVPRDGLHHARFVRQDQSGGQTGRSPAALFGKKRYQLYRRTGESTISWGWRGTMGSKGGSAGRGRVDERAQALDRA